jgi:hypothetical protein
MKYVGGEQQGSKSKPQQHQLDWAHGLSRVTEALHHHCTDREGTGHQQAHDEQEDVDIKV